MKKKIKNLLVLTIITCVFSSCLTILDEFNTSDPVIDFNNVWDDKNVYLNDEVILENDTLKIKKLQYVISKILLISDYDTILVKDYNLIKLNNSYSGRRISVDNVPNNTYKIVFTFGLENIDDDYFDLNAQNFNNLDNGYYFLKLEADYKQDTENMKYHIAKTLNTNYINSYETEIEGFKIGSLFVNQAVINVNLKNLFLNPNIINIDNLNPSVIQDSILQTKMMENAKNIFYLDRFSYD